MDTLARDLDFNKVAAEQGMHFDSERFAKWLDEHDGLRDYRDRFHHPTFKHLEKVTGLQPLPESERACREPVYLCGNSLGLQPRLLKEQLNVVLDQWAGLGVHAYHSGPLPASHCDEKLAEDTAKYIVGAEPDEVAITANLSVNMHVLLATFYRPEGKKNCVLLEKGSFPTDVYAVESQISWHGLDPKECVLYIGPRPNEWCLRLEDIIQKIKCNADRLALVWLSGVQYITGQSFDMERITKAVHSYANCPIGWDLAHSVGNVPLHLHDWDVDMAVWCSYKYLNGSPGALGGLFVHQKHHHRPGVRGPLPAVPGVIQKCPQLTGWWGHREETRFDMTGVMELATGAAAYRISNPPLLTAVALTVSTEIFKACGGMELVRKKSVILTGYLYYLLQNGRYAVSSPNFTIITPSEPQSRGAQLSICVHQGLKDIYDTLSRHGFIFDLRKPNIMRITPTALYNSFQDVFAFVKCLHEVSTKLQTCDGQPPASDQSGGI